MTHCYFTSDEITLINAQISFTGHIVIRTFNDNTPFAYSVGFTETYHHPEVIICSDNISPDTCTLVINQVAEMLHSKTLEKLEDNQTYYDILKGGLPVRAHRISPENRKNYLEVAGSRNEFNNLPWDALQLLIPDAKGCLPGDEEYCLRWQANNIVLA